MLSLLSLPNELLRLVHGWLLPAAGSYCRLHDRAAPLRCACKIAHAALSQVATKLDLTKGCVSLHSLTDGNYDAVRARISLHGHRYVCLGHTRPRAVCAVHDCCDPQASRESKEAVVKALRAIAGQVMRGNQTLRYQFLSWFHLAHFHNMLRQANINLSSKYSPVVTRVANGIRVSWVQIDRHRLKFAR